VKNFEHMVVKIANGRKYINFDLGQNLYQGFTNKKEIKICKNLKINLKK